MKYKQSAPKKHIAQEYKEEEKRQGIKYKFAFNLFFFSDFDDCSHFLCSLTPPHPCCLQHTDRKIAHAIPSSVCSIFKSALTLKKKKKMKKNRKCYNKNDSNQKQNIIEKNRYTYNLHEAKNCKRTSEEKGAYDEMKVKVRVWNFEAKREKMEMKWMKGGRIYITRNK